MRHIPPPKKLQTIEQHISFVRSLPCVRCNQSGIKIFSFDGDPKLSLHLCEDCGAHPCFLDEPKARRMARNVYLLSGDHYSCIQVILCNQEGVFC